MVFRKKQFRKKFPKRKRAWRRGRKYVKRKTMYATSKMIYKISLACQNDTIVIPPDSVNPGTYYTYEFSPSLSDIDVSELSAFTEIYDEFKIVGVTFSLRPRGNIAFTNNSVQPGTGLILSNQTGSRYYSVLDPSDLKPLLTPDSAREYTNCKVIDSWRPHRRTYKSSVPSLTYDVNNNPYLKVEGPRWMQLEPQAIAGTNYDDTILAHIGCKLIWDLNETNSSFVYDLYIKLHCMFRVKK
ncbi:putative capsid [uncultured virus]|uniref:Putative capsid n=1 Tax=uncultured virus TaxID=340016 RepID=A0A2K9LST0_9VIRU|nr:putative capsid [uncultured virus]